jgi:anthranilate phosphoribosyltransferase
VLNALIGNLQRGQELSPEEVKSAVAQLVDEGVSPELKAAFLSALAQKGETPEEISVFASELRDKSIEPPLDEETRQRDIIDVCGTGGDRRETFNISTTVALVLAGAGLTVAKHGNRAITSQAGSADVLEALGIRIDLSPEEAAASLRDHHFAFFFAQKYHPAFRHIGPARKLCAEKGQRTIFNFLGPLLNPARPSAQMIGVPDAALCEPVGRVLQSLGVRRGMVVSGAAGDGYLDEWSVLGENTVAEFYDVLGFSISVVSPKTFPCQPASLEDLKGGDSQTNAKIIRQILSGAEKGPKRDEVLLNSGAAFFVAGKARTIREGWQMAAEQIDSGAAAEKLKELASV